MAENMKKREARIQKAGGVIGGVIGIASIVFDKARQEQTGQEPEVDEDRYELISDEEIEEFLKQQEENEHEEKQKA